MATKDKEQKDQRESKKGKGGGDKKYMKIVSLAPEVI